MVFKVDAAGRRYALKCYTRKRSRTKEICREISVLKSDLLCGVSYLEEEIFVYDDTGTGSYHDVVLAEWIEGSTLEKLIRKAIHDDNAAALRTLARLFDEAALELLSQQWAHGDLKPENIIVTGSGSPTRLVLIDYDAMFLPCFEGSTTLELGTPFYQHPLRDAACFDAGIDDYPIAVISATLHVLATRPGVYKPGGSKDYFLFCPEEILSGSSAEYEEISETVAREGDAALYGLLESLASNTPKIRYLPEIISLFHKQYKAEEGSFAEDMVLYNHGPKWGFMSASEEVIIPPVFDSALEFSEGVAVVNIRGYYHYIDRNGTCILNCSRYDAIKSFSFGLAAVKRDGAWGYIDRRGTEIISPRFRRAFSIRDGKARVMTLNGENITLNMEEVAVQLSL